ncbi:MAG: response regulator [Patescibacteria group bacterium]
MKKILLIEDDPLLIDIYTRKLKEAGFLVLLMTEGNHKVLGMIKTEKPDLVILDIVLPRVDGWEILRAIKRDEDVKDTRVMVLSNLGQKEEIEKGLKLGAESYLIKAHYTPSEIVQEVMKLINE